MFKVKLIYECTIDFIKHIVFFCGPPATNEKMPLYATHTPTAAPGVMSEPDVTTVVMEYVGRGRYQTWTLLHFMRFLFIVKSLT